MTGPPVRRACGRAVLAALVLTAGAACGTDRTSAPAGTLLAPVDVPASMAPLPDGGLLVGERLTGRIERVDARGQVDPEPVATVAVSTSGQRGLLGLAVDGGGRVFAAWTDPSERL